jgi:MFS family permease
VIGSVVAERMEVAVGRANVLAITMVTTATMLAVPAFTTEPLVVAVSFLMTGLMLVVFNVVAVSLRQRIVPEQLLGRVSASHRLLAWGTLPVGALFGGLAGEVLGLRPTFLLAGLVAALLVVGRLVITDEAIRAAEEGRLGV